LHTLIEFGVCFSGSDDEVTDVAAIAERLLVAFDTALVVSVSALSEVGKIKKYPPARGEFFVFESHSANWE
jgi:hypothetical protein